VFCTRILRHMNTDLTVRRHEFKDSSLSWRVCQNRVNGK
jgi:hypothetical protein